MYLKIIKYAQLGLYITNTAKSKSVTRVNDGI